MCHSWLGILEKCKEVSDPTLEQLAWDLGNMHRKGNRPVCSKCQRFGQDSTCLRNLERKSVMQKVKFDQILENREMRVGRKWER